MLLEVLEAVAAATAAATAAVAVAVVLVLLLLLRRPNNPVADVNVFVVVNGEVDLCCLPRSTLGRNGCDKLSLPRYIGRGVVKVAVVEVVDGAAGGAAGGCGDC